MICSLALSAILGFEGNNLYRWSLERRRFRQQSIVTANSLVEAEHRFFSVAEVELSKSGGASVIVAIIDYGSGNLRSAEKAFERAAHETAVAASIQVTSDPEIVARAERVVLPGVGAFRDCRDGLDAVDGMRQAIRRTRHVRQAVPWHLRWHAAHGRSRP